METTPNTAEAIAEAEHTAFKIVERSGRRVFILYGMIEVNDFWYARELLMDRRKMPVTYPEPTLQHLVIEYEAPRGHGKLEKFPWE